MAEDSKAVVIRAYDAINSGRLDLLREVIADDFVEHDDANMMPTKEGVVQFFEALRESFANLHIAVDDVVAEGDRVSARIVLSGVHAADYLGVAATGRHINLPVADFFRVEGQQLAEHWGVSNQSMMLQQMGVSPSTAQADYTVHGGFIS